MLDVIDYSGRECRKNIGLRGELMGKGIIKATSFVIRAKVCCVYLLKDGLVRQRYLLTIPGLERGSQYQRRVDYSRSQC